MAGVIVVGFFGLVLATGHFALFVLLAAVLGPLEIGSLSLSLIAFLALAAIAITALGMLPLLFATGPGSEIQKPLAIVVTGGLVSATLLTLLLLPLIFERWSER